MYTKENTAGQKFLSKQELNQSIKANSCVKINKLN